MNEIILTWDNIIHGPEFWLFYPILNGVLLTFGIIIYYLILKWKNKK